MFSTSKIIKEDNDHLQQTNSLINLIRSTIIYQGAEDSFLENKVNKRNTK